jgi:hypothetical protein
MFCLKTKKTYILQIIYLLSSISLTAALPIQPNTQPIATPQTNPTPSAQPQEIFLLQEQQGNSPAEIDTTTLYKQAEQANNQLIQKQLTIEQAIQNYIKQKYTIDNSADDCAKLMGQKEGKIQKIIATIESHNKDRMNTFNTKLQEAQVAQKQESIPLLQSIIQELKAHLDAAHALQKSLDAIHTDFETMQAARTNLLTIKNQIQQKSLQHDTYTDQIQKLKSSIMQNSLSQMPALIMQQIKTIEENAHKISQEIIAQSNLNTLNEVRGLIQMITSKLQSLDGQLDDLATKLDTIKTMIESYESNYEQKVIQTIKTTSQQLAAEETGKIKEKEPLLKKLKHMMTFNKTVFSWIKEYASDVKKKLRAQE